METTSRKVMATSMPLNCANVRPILRSTRTTPVQKNNPPSVPTIRKSGVKSLAYMQETISNAFGMFFETTQDVNVTFVSDGSVMTVTCTANGLTATITMSENAIDEKGGQAS